MAPKMAPKIEYSNKAGLGLEHTKIKVTREREIGQALTQIVGIERKNVDLPNLGKFCTVHIIRNQDELRKYTNKQLSE